MRRLLYPRADMVTVQAEATAGPFARQVPGIKRLAVIPNPLPAPLLDAPLVAQRDGGPRELLAMGRLVPDKQFDLLIDVYAELAPRFPDWNLRIWGEGPQRAALESQVARLGLQARIRLPGRTETPWEALAQGRPSCSVRRSKDFRTCCSKRWHWACPAWRSTAPAVRAK